MKKPKSFHKKPEKLLGNEREGLLVAHFGATVEVEDANGQIIRCHLRKNLDPVITGDRVLWQPSHDNTGIIVGHLPRKSLLARPENKNKIKPVAANVDAMLIVTCPPVISEHLLDRYLVAAENLNILPLIVLNKMDLLNETTEAEFNQQLAVYEKIGYRILHSSTKTAHGLDELNEFLKDKTSVLVGTSGVGKSSIIAAFVKGQFVKVGETTTQGVGKHTTTMTRLYHRSEGGDLIDSPGIREFGLWNMSKKDIWQGFIELRPFFNKCKFSDCKHTNEPGCEVQKAIKEGKIHSRRFASLLEMMEQIPEERNY
ncbi:MAG: small ribosomal subunit biogenesis GTPase RsgA [Gammaproteobacteria bacterium]